MGNDVKVNEAGLKPPAPTKTGPTSTKKTTLRFESEDEAKKYIKEREATKKDGQTSLKHTLRQNTDTAKTAEKRLSADAQRATAEMKGASRTEKAGEVALRQQAGTATGGRAGDTLPLPPASMTRIQSGHLESLLAKMGKGPSIAAMQTPEFRAAAQSIIVSASNQFGSGEVTSLAIMFLLLEMANDNAKLNRYLTSLTGRASELNSKMNMIGAQMDLVSTRMTARASVDNSRLQATQDLQGGMKASGEAMGKAYQDLNAAKAQQKTDDMTRPQRQFLERRQQLTGIPHADSRLVSAARENYLRVLQATPRTADAIRTAEQHFRNVAGEIGVLEVQQQAGQPAAGTPGAATRDRRLETLRSESASLHAPPSPSEADIRELEGYLARSGAAPLTVPLEARRRTHPATVEVAHNNAAIETLRTNARRLGGAGNAQTIDAAKVAYREALASGDRSRIDQARTSLRAAGGELALAEVEAEPTGSPPTTNAAAVEHARVLRVERDTTNETISTLQEDNAALEAQRDADLEAYQALVDYQQGTLDASEALTASGRDAARVPATDVQREEAFQSYMREQRAALAELPADYDRLTRARAQFEQRLDAASRPLDERNERLRAEAVGLTGEGLSAHMGEWNRVRDLRTERQAGQGVLTHIDARVTTLERESTRLNRELVGPPAPSPERITQINTRLSAVNGELRGSEGPPRVLGLYARQAALVAEVGRPGVPPTGVTGRLEEEIALGNRVLDFANADAAHRPASTSYAGVGTAERAYDGKRLAYERESAGYRALVAERSGLEHENERLSTELASLESQSAALAQERDGTPPPPAARRAQIDASLSAIQTRRTAIEARQAEITLALEGTPASGSTPARPGLASRIADADRGLRTRRVELDAARCEYERQAGRARTSGMSGATPAGAPGTSGTLNVGIPPRSVTLTPTSTATDVGIDEMRTARAEYIGAGGDPLAIADRSAGPFNPYRAEDEEVSRTYEAIPEPRPSPVDASPVAAPPAGDTSPEAERARAIIAYRAARDAAAAARTPARDDVATYEARYGLSGLSETPARAPGALASLSPPVTRAEIDDPSTASPDRRAAIEAFKQERALARMQIVRQQVGPQAIEGELIASRGWSAADTQAYAQALTARNAAFTSIPTPPPMPGEIYPPPTPADAPAPSDPVLARQQAIGRYQAAEAAVMRAEVLANAHSYRPPIETPAGFSSPANVETLRGRMESTARAALSDRSKAGERDRARLEHDSAAALAALDPEAHAEMSRRVADARSSRDAARSAAAADPSNTTLAEAATAADQAYDAAMRDRATMQSHVANAPRERPLDPASPRPEETLGHKVGTVLVGIISFADTLMNRVFAEAIRDTSRLLIDVSGKQLSGMNAARSELFGFMDSYFLNAHAELIHAQAQTTVDLERKIALMRKLVEDHMR